MTNEHGVRVGNLSFAYYFCRMMNVYIEGRYEEIKSFEVDELLTLYIRVTLR
jgi:hypothetical protein